MPPGLIKNRHSGWLKRPGMWGCRRVSSSPYRRAFEVSSQRWVEGHSLQHAGLLGMERGDDFSHEGFGGTENFDAEDIPRIAEFDGDAWRDFDRSGHLALVTDQIKHV